MDKLTIISGCLFLAADIFAIASIANPDWINTGESAGERRGPGAQTGCGARAGGRPEATGGRGERGAEEDALVASGTPQGRRVAEECESRTGEARSRVTATRPEGLRRNELRPGFKI